MQTDGRITFAEAVRDALRDAMKADDSVVLLGEDIGTYGGAFGITRGLLDEFTARRVKDCPISEAAITSMAVGAAMAGLKPVVEIMFEDFITLATDSLVNHAAKIHYMFNGQYRVPLVVRAPIGAGRGYGPSHSQSLISMFAHVPGLKIVIPSTPGDAYALLRASIDDPNPVLFLEHKLLYAVSADAACVPATGQIGPVRMAREGRDVTLVTFGNGVVLAEEAAGKLAERGVSAEIVDVRTVRPLDKGAIVASCSKTKHAVVVTEEYPFCSVAAELCALIQEECWDRLEGPVIRLTGQDAPIPCAASIEQSWLPSVDAVVKAALRAATKV